MRFLNSISPVFNKLSLIRTGEVRMNINVQIFLFILEILYMEPHMKYYNHRRPVYCLSLQWMGAGFMGLKLISGLRLRVRAFAHRKWMMDDYLLLTERNSPHHSPRVTVQIYKTDVAENTKSWIPEQCVQGKLDTLETWDAGEPLCFCAVAPVLF